MAHEKSSKDLKPREYYLENMAKFFRDASQYRGIAVTQCYFTYMDLNQGRNLIDLIESDEGTRQIAGSLRANAFNVSYVLFI